MITDLGPNGIVEIPPDWDIVYGLPNTFPAPWPVPGVESQPYDTPLCKPHQGLFYFAHVYSVKDSAGNYVLDGEDANFALCCQRTARLTEAGWLVYSPICETHVVHRASPLFLSRHEHDYWYKRDEEFIKLVKWAGIILAPGWETSEGCRREKDMFTSMGLPALYYSALGLP